MTTHPSLQPTQPYPDDAGLVLLPLARHAIADHLGAPAPPAAGPGAGADGAAWLDQPGAAFVTLTQGGSLRGCVGSLVPHRSLREDVEANAVAAGCFDPRFPSLTREELDRVLVEVSVLSAPRPLRAADEAELLTLLRPGLDGVILSARRHRATFLPQVWEQLPDPAEFLAQLRLKAGLPPGYWGPDVEVETYEVTAWRESEPGVPAARAESPALPEAPATPGSWPARGEP